MAHTHSPGHPDSEDAHSLEQGHSHDHTHGTIDPRLLTTARGISTVKWSLVVLGVTALFQVAIVIYTGSVALLADTIHNFGDAATAIPLWIAFTLASKKPTARFNYGYGRTEDWAGVLVVLTILFSAVIAGWQAVERLLHPQPLEHLWAVAVAAIVGFIGNEAVALWRIRVGKEIKRAALVADGYHARTDGLTSLAVLAGAIGVWLGFPLADPLIGLGITAAILVIVWQSAKTVFPRLLDAVDPEVTQEIRDVVVKVEGVIEVTEVRARWLGHELHAEVNLAVDRSISVSDGHDVSLAARHELMHELPYLSNVTVHVDPDDSSGEDRHRVDHAHDEAPLHSHS